MGGTSRHGHHVFVRGGRFTARQRNSFFLFISSNSCVQKTPENEARVTSLFYFALRCQPREGRDQQQCHVVPRKNCVIFSSPPPNAHGSRFGEMRRSRKVSAWILVAFIHIWPTDTFATSFGKRAEKTREHAMYPLVQHVYAPSKEGASKAPV